MNNRQSVPSLPDELGPWRKLLATTLIVWSALALYYVITLSQPPAPLTVVMPAWVPFWPVFTLPYLALLVVTWLLPVVLRDAGRFRACLRAMVYAFLLVVPWWILIPTRLDRPPLPQGWWVGPYLWLIAMDPPHCILPCAHGIGPTVAAWFVASERATWRWPLAAMLVLALPSIAFVGQHRPVDILIGMAAAAVGIAIAQTSHRLSKPAGTPATAGRSSR